MVTAITAIFNFLTKIRIKKSPILTIIIFLCVAVIISSSIFSNAIDFNGSQHADYKLSNGENVRIEYHGGEPHYHDSKGSARLSDGKPHHNDNKLPKKSTRDIMSGKKAKSKSDKAAKRKADEWKKEWEKAKSNSKKSSKSFIKKKKKLISQAAKEGKVIIIIGGIVYVIWLLIKIASGWGIIIPV